MKRQTDLRPLVVEKIKPLPLIVFSGGLDSTVLLFQALREGDCDVVYIRGNQGDLKIHHELKARKKIIACLEKLTGNKVRFDATISAQMDGFSNNVKLAQPLAWLTALSYYVQKERTSCVRLGYIRGDHMAQYADNYIQSWDSISRYTLHDNIPMELPLLQYNKVEMLDIVPAPVYQHVWFCESPAHTRAKPCGRCTPCLTHRGSIAMFNVIHGEDSFQNSIKKHSDHYKRLRGKAKLAYYGKVK